MSTCSYQGCYKQRYPCGSITFFQIPMDEPRRTQWILNSGNKRLRSLTSTQKRYLCENHFHKKDIKWYCYRKTLHKNAVPIPYDTLNEQTQYVEYEVVEVEFQHAEVTSSDNTHLVDKISEYNDKNEIEENVLLSPNHSCILSDTDNEEEMNETICTEEALSTTEMDSSQTYLVHINTTQCDLSAQPVADLISAYADCESPSNPENDLSVSNSALLADKDCITRVETISTQTVMNNDNEINCDTNAITMTNDKPSDIPNDSILQCIKNPQSSSSGENSLANINQFQEQRMLQSYESDKHFSLSLVYYFQRLNAKKNMKAKFDILSYLMALQQDDDAQLGSDKLVQKAN